MKERKNMMPGCVLSNKSIVVLFHWEIKLLDVFFRNVENRQMFLIFKVMFFFF